MVLPRYKSSMVLVDNVDLAGINITDLLGKHFEERVMAMIELFASALWRSSQEFLGEYFTIWNQIGCLNDPIMCHKIAFVLQKAFSPKNFEETKRLVVESFRDRNLRFKDLENGLCDKWCHEHGIPVYRGRLHIFSRHCQLWRNQIAKLSTNPAALFSRFDPCYADFESLRNFLLDTKPVITDQMNEEMIKPAKHLPRQSLSNLDALSWKLVGMFNERITFTIVERYRGPLKTQLFSDYRDPFSHSTYKQTRPYAKISLGRENKICDFSKFFPKWSQLEWDRMRKKLHHGVKVKCEISIDEKSDLSSSHEILHFKKSKDEKSDSTSSDEILYFKKSTDEKSYSTSSDELLYFNRQSLNN